MRFISGAPGTHLFVMVHASPPPPALIPTKLLASAVITRGETGLFDKAKHQYEQLRNLFLNTPDPAGARIWEHTLALVGPLLGVPVAISDLEGLAKIGIGEAAPGERTVTSSAVESSTHGAGTAEGSAGKPTTVPSEGKGLGSGTPSGKGATKHKGKGASEGHGAGKTTAVSSEGTAEGTGAGKTTTVSSEDRGLGTGPNDATGSAVDNSAHGASKADGKGGGAGTSKRSASTAKKGACKDTTPLHPFPRDTVLLFHPGKSKRGYSGKLFEVYLNARTVGEYSDLHPGDTHQVRKRQGNDPTRKPDARSASKGLANDLQRFLCSIPGYTAGQNLKFAKQDDEAGPDAPPGGRKPVHWTRPSLQELPDHVIISFLGTGLHARGEFPRGVRSLLALREAVENEPWTWSSLARHVNKQHASVSARDVVVGYAPPWTAAQVRHLNARYAFAVGRQHRGAVPTSFRICSTTEPDLPAAGNLLRAAAPG